MQMELLQSSRVLLLNMATHAQKALGLVGRDVALTATDLDGRLGLLQSSMTKLGLTASANGLTTVPKQLEADAEATTVSTAKFFSSPNVISLLTGNPDLVPLNLQEPAVQDSFSRSLACEQAQNMSMTQEAKDLLCDQDAPWVSAQSMIGLQFLDIVSWEALASGDIASMCVGVGYHARGAIAGHQCLNCLRPPFVQANPGFDTGYAADNLLSSKNDLFTSSPYPINVPSQDFFTNIASNFTNSTAPRQDGPCESKMEFKKVCAQHMHDHATLQMHIYFSMGTPLTCLSGCSSFKKQKKMIRKDCQ